MPVGADIRPTMDRVREAMFNILAHRDWGKKIGAIFDGDVAVLDAFCGVGALAFEALSWGARRATLFDKDAQALKTARQNATTLDITDKCQILAADATQPPKNNGTPCKLVFFDPPYRKDLIPVAFKALDEAGWIAPHALIVAETAKTERLETLPGCELILARAYGEPMLHFMVR